MSDIEFQLSKNADGTILKTTTTTTSFTDQVTIDPDVLRRQIESLQAQLDAIEQFEASEETNQAVVISEDVPVDSGEVNEGAEDE